MIPHLLLQGEQMHKTRLDKLIQEQEQEKESKDLPFLQSLRNNLEKWGNLTEKQVKAMERIEYLSSPEGKEAVVLWQKKYISDHRSDATICAHYYLANPPYFNDLATKIITQEGFVPTEKQYMAMCDNKYTKRVLREAKSDPEYARGDIVQVRNAEALPYTLYALRGKPCVVIDNTSGHITTHAIGAKVYRILPFGESSIAHCQERYLKNFKAPSPEQKGEKNE